MAKSNERKESTAKAGALGRVKDDKGKDGKDKDGKDKDGKGKGKPSANQKTGLKESMRGQRKPR